MSAHTQDEVAALAVAQQSQYLTFMLGAETFAIGILAIKEIIEFDKLTTVPMMPGFVRGIINLRGAVVPVIDLSMQFQRASTEVTRRTCIVIIEVGSGDRRQDMGVLVDAVNEVLEIQPSQIEAPPAFGCGIRKDLIAGIGKLDERLLIILDADRALSGAQADQMLEATQPP